MFQFHPQYAASPEHWHHRRAPPAIDCSCFSLIANFLAGTEDVLGSHGPASGLGRPCFNVVSSSCCALPKGEIVCRLSPEGLFTPWNSYYLIDLLFHLSCNLKDSYDFVDYMAFAC